MSPYAIADEKEGVIVACAATRQETDTGQLVPMIQQARENLGPAAARRVTGVFAGSGFNTDPSGDPGIGRAAVFSGEWLLLQPPRRPKHATRNVVEEHRVSERVV